MLPLLPLAVLCERAKPSAAFVFIESMIEGHPRPACVSRDAGRADSGEACLARREIEQLHQMVAERGCWWACHQAELNCVRVQIYVLALIVEEHDDLSDRRRSALGGPDSFVAVTFEKRPPLLQVFVVLGRIDRERRKNTNGTSAGLRKVADIWNGLLEADFPEGKGS